MIETKMNINDMLKHQMETASMLYMVLKDGDMETLYRYPHKDADQVMLMLKDYRYVDTRIGIPRFEKKAKKNVAKTA